jgi:tetratricopeptide (TPR) repeat protein
MLTKRRHWIQSKKCDSQLQFEELLVEFSKKAIEKNTEALESYVSQAMRIAEAEGSSLMRGMVHLHLANAYLVVEKLKPALNNFRKATVEARASREINGLIAIEMEIQSLNGEGDVFFAMKNYSVAGKVYKEAVKTAETAEQYLSVMDGWLMVTFCYELQERYIDAYRSCEYALLAGENLSESERPKQGLAEVVDTLLRIINLLKINQSAAVSPNAFSKEHEIEARMIELIGTDWRKHLSGKG